MKYTIILIGCDAETEFNIDLKEDEYKLIKRIAKLSEETSTFECMPTLEISKVNENNNAQD